MWKVKAWHFLARQARSEALRVTYLGIENRLAAMRCVLTLQLSHFLMSDEEHPAKLILIIDINRKPESYYQKIRGLKPQQGESTTTYGHVRRFDAVASERWLKNTTAESWTKRELKFGIRRGGGLYSELSLFGRWVGVDPVLSRSFPREVSGSSFWNIFPGRSQWQLYFHLRREIFKA